MTSLLIDADIFLFRAASSAEVEIDWGDGLWTLHSESARACAQFKDAVSVVAKELDATDVILCFSDPSRRCFRYDVSPSYKANRKDTRKPLAYHPMRLQLMAEHKSIIKPGLEADDVMGIVSTRAPGRYVIVSADKDMKTIPGQLYRQGAVHTVTEAEADYWHAYQTLIGDTTDGYPGCPGVGPKGAEGILAHTASLTDDRDKWWHETWLNILAAFRKAKLDEDAAITQARLARILRSSDWCFKTSTPKLWSPPNVHS